jgi:hypothetical protein
MVVDPDYQGSRFEMPEPPAHLGKPEQALWRDLTAEHDFATTASLELLIKAMEAHMRFRASQKGRHADQRPARATVASPACHRACSGRAVRRRAEETEGAAEMTVTYTEADPKFPRRISPAVRQIFAQIKAAEPFAEQWYAWQQQLHDELGLPPWHWPYAVLGPDDHPGYVSAKTAELARYRYQVLNSRGEE